MLEEFAGHAAKVHDDARGVDAGSLAVRALAGGVDAVGGGLELDLQIVQSGPGFGDVGTPFTFEAFELGVRRRMAGKIFLDQAGDGAQGGAVIREVEFE